MIPKIIHYVWIGGNPLPEKFQNYIAGWKKLMPDYEFMEWNENNFDFSNCKFAAEAFARKKYAFVSDFIRVAVLKKYGGVYMDTDVEVLKPFTPLLNDGFFIGFENDGHVESAVMGCEPDHPLISELYSFYTNASFVNKKKENITPNVIYLTYFLKRDYSLKIQAVNQTLTNADTGSAVTVYAPEYFTPLNFNTGKENVTENSYAVHRFANSWSPKSLKTAQKFVNFLRKILGRRIFASILRQYSKTECKKAEKYIRSLQKNMQSSL